MGKQNVFSGKNAVKDFLNPEKNSYTPLIELPPSLNPYYKDGVRIYAKLLNMLPLGNVKSLSAFNMLTQAEKKDELKNTKKLIESSSGNTAASLAIIGNLLGITQTKALVSNEITPGKLNLLRLFGVDVEINEEPICPDPADKESGIYKAKKIGSAKNWFNASQYENDENPKAHEKWTAKQIWNQLNGNIHLFCAGMGTTGTIVGCSQFFKRKNKNVQTVGVLRKPNNPVPGVRTRGLLDMVAFNWKNHVDSFEEIGTEESYEKSLELIRNGIIVGPSSGFAYAGLLKHLKSLKEQKKLNTSKKINVVFICCDSPLPYLEEYFSHLDDTHFPTVTNEELLLEKPDVRNHKTHHNYDSEISAQELYSRLYDLDKRQLWNSIKQGKNIKTERNSLVIDLRTKEEFDHFHIAGSKHLPYKKILLHPKQYVKKLKGKKIVLVCRLGLKSNSLARILKKEGIDSYSLIGGITEWSNLDLPRWKPDICFRPK